MREQVIAASVLIPLAYAEQANIILIGSYLKRPEALTFLALIVNGIPVNNRTLGRCLYHLMLTTFLFFLLSFLSLTQSWQSALQRELAVGAPHPSPYLRVPVLEPKVPQNEPHGQREAKAVI